MLYLFDIDGTLLLSGGAGARALDHVFTHRYNISGAMRDIQPGGKTDPMILTEVFENFLGRRPSQAEIDDILAAYLPRLVASLAESENFRLMPAVHEALDFLGQQAGVLLALATGNIRAAAHAKLEHAQLAGHFITGGFGDDSADRSELVARAIERSEAHAARRIAREDIVVVGDTERDIHAARACGVRVIAVATGSASRERLLAEGPDAVFDTLAELPAWHRAQPRSRN